MKKTFRLLLSTLLLVSISTPMLADTIRLKDGSVIRGQVIGFKDQQFTILIGGNARGRRGQTTVYVEDVESIEFDSNSGNTGSSSTGASSCTRVITGASPVSVDQGSEISARRADSSDAPSSVFAVKPGNTGLLDSEPGLGWPWMTVSAAPSPSPRSG